MLKSPLKSPDTLEFDQDFLQTAPEWAIYIVALCVVNEIWAEEKALNSKEIDKATFLKRATPSFGKLWTVANVTHRFGVIIPMTPQAGFSPFFWRWFNWWDDHRRRFTDEQITQMDPNTFRPPGDWTHYKSAPPFTSFRFAAVWPRPQKRPAL